MKHPYAKIYKKWEKENEHTRIGCFNGEQKTYQERVYNEIAVSFP